MKIDIIKQLPLAEIKQLHKKYMVNDFPRNELRPYVTIQHLYFKQQYVVFGAYIGDELIAYSCFLLSQKSPVILLDYFAVVPQLRGTGLGSQFIQQLPQIVQTHYSHINTIVIECENPTMAENKKEKEIRNRRIGFYQKNGAVMSQCGWYAFGVDYILLFLPVCDKQSDVHIIKSDYTTLGKAVYQLYLSGFSLLSKPMTKKNLKYYSL